MTVNPMAGKPKLKLKPLPEPAKLPPGVVKVFHAQCTKCQWRGPDRDNATMAGYDYVNHKRIAEMFVYQCSKMAAKIDAEDKEAARRKSVL